MKLDDNTKYGTVKIQGVDFEVPQPYVAGTRELTEGEASQLNQVLAENLRNNFASTVDKAQEDAAKANGVEVTAVTNDMLDLGALNKAFEDYCDTYEFGVRRGGAPRITDPIEREAMDMATAAVREAIKKQGIKLADVPAEKIRDLSTKLLAKNPAIREEAKRRVEATRGIALDELDLSGAATPPASNGAGENAAAPQG